MEPERARRRASRRGAGDPMTDGARPPTPSRVERLASAWVRACERRPLLVIAAAVAVCVASGVSARRVHLDAHLQSILPAHSDSLRALGELRDRVAGDAPYLFLVASDDPALNRRLAATLRERASRWPETLWAITRRDPSHLLDRRLLLLRRETLEGYADRVERRVRYEEREAALGGVSLSAPPAWPDEAEVRAALEALPGVRTLARFLEADADVRRAIGASTDRDRLGELCAADGKLCAVQGALGTDAADLDEAGRLLARGNALIAEVRPGDAPPSLRMVVSGRYRNGPMMAQAIRSDIVHVSLLSAALLLAIVVVQLRGARAPAVVIVPIAVGELVTAGALGALHPALNIIGAFSFAILGGIGIDFAIHMLTHYAAERERGAPVAEALTHTLVDLASPLSAACATACCAFGALGAADHRGFAEMGLTSAFGVAVSLLATLLFFPAAVLALHRLVPERGSMVRARTRLSLPLPSVATARALAILGGLLVALAAVAVPRLAFEHNHHRLQPPGVGHGLAVSRAVHGTTGSPVYLLADDPETLARAAEDLERRGFDAVAPMGGAVLIAPRTFIPEEQEAKLAAVARIRRALERGEPHLDGDARAQIAPLRRWLGVTDPVDPGRLPPWLRGWLVERDGRAGRIAVLIARLAAADGKEMERLAEAVAAWRSRYPGVRFASTEALLGEVVPGLRRDTPRVVGLALLGLVLSTLLVGRSSRRTLLVVLAVVASTTLTLGAMALLGMRLNLYNLLVIPVAIGVGIDGAVYVVWAMLDGADRESAWEKLRGSAQAILSTNLTTIAAFASLTVATHVGLASLGTLGVLAMTVAFVTNVGVLPLVLSLRR